MSGAEKMGSVVFSAIRGDPKAHALRNNVRELNGRTNQIEGAQGAVTTYVMRQKLCVSCRMGWV